MGEKPVTEIKLELLQDKWRKENDQVAYQEMFEILVQYSRSIILKMTRGKKFLNPDYVFNKAVDATIKFLEQYEKNPDYHVDYSFGGVLRYKVLECLYGPKERKIDDITSINSFISNMDDEFNELEELQIKLDMQPVWSPNSSIQDPVYAIYHTEETAMHTVLSVIHDMYNKNFNWREVMLLMIAVLQTFRKCKTLPLFLDTYLNTKDLRDGYDLTMLEIHNRLSEEV